MINEGFFSKKEVFLHHFPPKYQNPSSLDFKQVVWFPQKLRTYQLHILRFHQNSLNSNYIRSIIIFADFVVELIREINSSLKCKCLIICHLVLIESMATNLRIKLFKTVIFTKTHVLEHVIFLVCNKTLIFTFNHLTSLYDYKSLRHLISFQWMCNIYNQACVVKTRCWLLNLMNLSTQGKKKGIDL